MAESDLRLAVGEKLIPIYELVFNTQLDHAVQNANAAILANVARDVFLDDNYHSKKTLIFCNVRYEVEQTAVYLQRNLPFETAVFTHYSNLDKTLRQETEQGFAQASTAICVSTSTLELGIDIGSVEDVILIGPPPTLTSFL